MELYTEQSNSHKHGVMQGLPLHDPNEAAYLLGDSIRRAYLKHGNNSWTSIARDVIAELSGSPSVGKAGGDESVSDGHVHDYKYTESTVRQKCSCFSQHK